MNPTIVLKVFNLTQLNSDINKQLKQMKLDTPKITVGFHATDSKYKDGTTTAEVAAYNHFGTEHIPARPFLDVGVKKIKRKINRTVGEQLEKGTDLETIMNAVGSLAVRGVQEQIDRTHNPPNSPITILRKKSSHPLIDTGHMKQSVSYQFVTKKDKQ